MVKFEHKKTFSGSHPEEGGEIAAGKDSLRLLKAALEAADNAILITDRRGVIVWVNPAFNRLTGYSLSESIGQNARMQRPVEHDVLLYRRLWETILAGQIYRGEMTSRRKDGSLYVVENTITPVLNARGEITHFISVKRDITEKLEREVLLRQAQKMEAVGTLAGGIAHDFNNIVGAIMAYTNLALLDSGENAVLTENLQQVLRAANRAKELVSQLLAFSRREKHKRQPVKLPAVISEALKTLRQNLPATIEIVPQLDDAAPSVLADPAQIRQVLMNLCANAAEAMTDKPGRLVVSLKSLMVKASVGETKSNLPAGLYAVMSVTDTGHGMDAQTMKRMFDPYFTTKPSWEGAGLGLAVAHGIVQEHEGFIQAESQVGRGTSFHLYFPARKSEPATAEPLAGNSPKGRGKSILISPSVRVQAVPGALEDGDSPRGAAPREAGNSK